MVGNTGNLKRSDFDRFIEWSEPRIQLYREAFTFGGEQPLLNYLLMKKWDKKEITLKRLNFMREGLNPETAQVSIERIKKKEGYPFIIHWHDKKPGVMIPSMKKIPRNDILLFFEDLYYRGAGISPKMQQIRIKYEYSTEVLKKTISNSLSNNSKTKNILKKILSKYGKRIKV